MHAQRPDQTGTVGGRVLDLQTGEPIAKASVSVAGQALLATTGDDGRFTLSPIPAGTVELRISTVGYGLLKRAVEVSPGATVELDLRLGQEAFRDTQQITVTTGPFDPVVQDAPTQYTLDNTELQDLSTVLANDPFRAVASLPGVSSNLDAYADFSLRGAGLPHVGVYVDGVLVDRPTYGFEDSGDFGSLSVVNGDEVASLSLLSGGFPASYGDRTGAILAIATRDGARDRVFTRLTADVLGAVATSEGPIGKSRKASWLVSGRQSYLAYLLDRLGVGNGLTLNYTDAAGKLGFDPAPRHKFTVGFSYGTASSARSPARSPNASPGFFTSGHSQHGMASVHWDWVASPDTLLQTQFFWTHDGERDLNPTSAADLDTASNVFGFRQDFTHEFAKRNKFQAGVESRTPFQRRYSATQWNFATRTFTSGLLPFDSYSRSEWQPGAYIEDSATLLKDRITFTLGGRWAYSTPAGQSVWLPHASAILRPARASTITLSFGQYAQMPALQQRYGAFGNPSLSAERATHQTIALDQFLTGKLRIHLELYNRQEHQDIYAPGTEFRLLANGQVGFPVLGPVLGNQLEAYARGIEVSIQRRTANRLSGWVAYSRSYSKYWQSNTTFSFPGDFDQRDTFSAYAAYRITRTIAVSANSRFGSGLPIPGFLAPSSIVPPGGTKSTPVYFLLSQSRNNLRAGTYLRNDIRASKVFNRRRLNLTIHGELENLSDHTNYAFYGFFYPADIASSHFVYASRQSTLPLLPAAGLTLEF